MEFDLDAAGHILKGRLVPPYAPPHPEVLTIDDLEQLQKDLAVVVGWIHRAMDAVATDEDLQICLRLYKWLTPIDFDEQKHLFEFIEKDLALPRPRVNSFTGR
jgi:hypothetical protein